MLTHAIVIKKQSTKEYDQLVTFYTKDFGKLVGIAKSILKPSSIQSLHLDVFNLVEFDLINGRGMPIVTGAQIVNSYMGIKSSIMKTAIAYFFIEALDKMVFENDKDKKLWSFLTSFLSELNDNEEPIKLFRKGQVRLLGIFGYLPEINFCGVCDTKIDSELLGAFNYGLGGVICKTCFLSGNGGILISQEDFRLMQGILPKVKLLETKRGVRRSILDGMFEYISGSKFYSLDILNMIK